MDITKNEYRIIGILYENGCFSKLRSFKIKRIASETNLSVVKIRLTMKKFIENGLIEKGARDERADTFFLTKKGIEVAEESMTIDEELLEKIKKIRKMKIEKESK